MKRYINFLTGVFVYLILIVTLIACQSEDRQVEKAILAEDWGKVAKLLDSVTPETPSPVLRLIKGHATLAINRNNESLCLFLSASSEDDLKKWDEWTRDFTNKNPKNPIAYYLKGDALARLEKWDEALKTFNKALELNPKHAMVLNARGVVYAARGEWDNAIKDFETTKFLNSSFVDAYVSAGAMWIQKSDGAPGALKDFKKALEKSPDFALALYGKGAVEMVLGELEDSSNDLENAMKKDVCLKQFIAIQVADMLQTINAQEEKDIVLAEGKIPGTEIEKRFKSNIDQIKAGNFGPWNGPLNQAIKQMDTHPNLKEVWKNEMKNIDTNTNRRLQDSIEHRGKWKNPHIDIELTAKAGKLGDVGLGAKYQTNLPGYSQTWKDSQVLLPNVTRSGGFDTTIAQAMWDKGNWPFNAQYGLLYKTKSKETSRK